MKERSILSRVAALCMLVLACAPRSSAQNFTDVKPSPQQVAWQDLEIGAIIHFGPNTFMDREWGDGTADPSVFNPSAVDPEQWMRAAKTAGIKYVVFVAKHHDGFCLWPTEQTQYSVKSSPWKAGHGDLVGEVAAAAHKYGLKFGVYLSPWDRHVYDFDRYVDNLRVYQPNAMVFADAALLKYGDIRWVGNEAGNAQEDNWNVLDLHGYLRYRPAEADTPLRKEHWFWHPNDEQSLKSLSELLDTYHKTVGRGAQLMIGLAPDNRGLLPDSDVNRLKEFGEALGSMYAPAKNLAASATNTSAFRGALDSDPDTVWSPPEGSHSAVIDLVFAHPITFDRALTLEWRVDGQKVQKYAIQVMEAKKWTTIYSGTTLGHKKIDLFQRTTAQRVRLNILSASSTPRIREFQLFDETKAR